MTNGSRQVHQYKPYPDHVECCVQVVKDLKERDTHDKNEDREVVKRSLEIGKSDDPVDVDKFGKRHKETKTLEYLYHLFLL